VPLTLQCTYVILGETAHSGDEVLIELLPQFLTAHSVDGICLQFNELLDIALEDEGVDIHLLLDVLGEGSQALEDGLLGGDDGE
jgi:hypothetical protein